MNHLLYIHWDIDPVIFKAGFITFTYYGALFAGGFFISSYILKKVYDEDKIPESTFFSLIYYCFWGIAVGARLGHCLFYQPAYFLSHPAEIIFPFSFGNGTFACTGYRGLASHGGTAGLIIALILYSGKKRQNIINTFDRLAIVVPLGAGFIRLANLMNSEIIGKPAELPWAFVFERVDYLPRHPAQLYEAIFYLSLFVLTYRLRKIRTKLKTGFLFGTVLLLIFTFRFFIEFLKERQVDFENSMYLDMGQLLSIPFILTGLYFVFVYKNKTFKPSM
jgi:prolipoprotein diacylglyceryl transferase